MPQVRRLVALEQEDMDTFMALQLKLNGIHGFATAVRHEILKFNQAHNE